MFAQTIHMAAINTALFSYGMSGSVFHAPFIHVHPGFNLYAVLERSKQSAMERYPGIKTYKSAEEMLADTEIELVVVNTPNSTHFDLARQALQAGKHVIVEKPFTTNLTEAEELLTLAAQKNVQLAVYHNRRWDSDFLTIKKVLSEKLLGEVVEAELHFDRYKEVISPKKHKEIPGPGTGILFDLGSHLIDQSIVLFGIPEAVFADLRIVRPVSDVDDYMEVLLYYPTLRVRLKASYLVREPLPSFSFFGSKGTFIKSRADVQEDRLQEAILPGSENWGMEKESEQGLLHTEINGETIRKKIPTERGDYMSFYESVYQALRNDKPMAVSGTDGLNVMRVLDAAVRSSKEQKVIKL